MLRALVTPTPLPRTFWILWTGLLVNRVGAFVVPFLTLFLVRERGFSTEEAGTLVSLYGAGTLVATLGGGVLADRLGRRPTMLGGLILGGAAMLALGISTDRARVAGLILLLGMVNDAYRPAMSATVADLVPPADRARAFGWTYWASNLGFAIAPLLAGFLADRHFLALFVGDATTTLLCALGLALFVPETRPAAAAQRQGRGSILTPLRDPVFMPFVFLQFLVASLFMQCSVGIPLAMVADGLSMSDVGPALALNGALIVVLQPTLTPRLARYPRRHVLAIGALLVGTGFGLYALAHTLPAYAACTAVWTIGEILVLPTAMAVVADLSPEALRGQYQGVSSLAWSGATILAPAASAFVFARYGAPTLWLACGLSGALAALGHTLLWRRASPGPKVALGD